MKHTDLTGRVFERCTVLKFHHRTERADRPHTYRYFYECMCSCGQHFIACGDSLKSGHVTSCGCFRHQCATIKNTTHGIRFTNLYRRWTGIKSRCYNPKSPNYKYYGARGIKMCDEWKNNVCAFYNWALSHGYKHNLTIDRIDVNGDYCPENCRWVNLRTQANNRRNSRLITYQGKTQTIKMWCDELGIKYRPVCERIARHNWSPDDAFTKPLKGGKSLTK